MDTPRWKDRKQDHEAISFSSLSWKKLVTYEFVHQQSQEPSQIRNERWYKEKKQKKKKLVERSDEVEEAYCSEVVKQIFRRRARLDNCLDIKRIIRLL